MSEYVVEPKSRWQLRQLANVLRDKLGLHDTLFFPIVELLDLMCELFEGFSYEIVPDSEFPPNIHGDTNILKQHIRIKESVYNGAANGVGRDRMTMAYELETFPHINSASREPALGRRGFLKVGPLVTSNAQANTLQD